mmetsp:Transcript_8889/g.26107  ORF Transcript_8889/g.26107 Transcript_8889/m.26107 type:complete len:262 (+) Transcript_8889:416-1201(+)
MGLGPRGCLDWPRREHRHHRHRAESPRRQRALQRPHLPSHGDWAMGGAFVSPVSVLLADFPPVGRHRQAPAHLPRHRERWLPGRGARPVAWLQGLRPALARSQHPRFRRGPRQRRVSVVDALRVGRQGDAHARRSDHVCPRPVPHRAAGVEHRAGRAAAPVLRLVLVLARQHPPVMDRRASAECHGARRHARSHDFHQRRPRSAPQHLDWPAREQPQGARRPLHARAAQPGRDDGGCEGLGQGRARPRWCRSVRLRDEAAG